jgi:hypothetical protein
MAETHILFQTIKIGESGIIDDDPPKEYSSEVSGFGYFDSILLADVKPFRIIGGHVTTNILENVSLLGVRLQDNKRSYPVIIDFQESTPGFQDYSVTEFEKLKSIRLKRSMSGSLWLGYDLNKLIIDYELENITHLYLLLNPDTKLRSHYTVSMTLVVEPDPDTEKKLVGKIKNNKVSVVGRKDRIILF